MKTEYSSITYVSCRVRSEPRDVQLERHEMEAEVNCIRRKQVGLTGK